MTRDPPDASPGVARWTARPRSGPRVRIRRRATREGRRLHVHERTKPTILVQLDTDPQPSVFDARGGRRRRASTTCSATAGSRPRTSATWSTAPSSRGARPTCIARRSSSAGRRSSAGEAVLEAVKKTFFGPLPGLGPVRRQRLRTRPPPRPCWRRWRAAAGRSQGARVAVLAATGPGRPADRPAARPARRARSPSARATSTGPAPLAERLARDHRRPGHPVRHDRPGRASRRRLEGAGRDHSRGRRRAAPARRRSGRACPGSRSRSTSTPSPPGDRGGRGDRQGQGPTATASAPGGRSASAAPR